jgi:hypothetical protein
VLAGTDKAASRYCRRSAGDEHRSLGGAALVGEPTAALFNFLKCLHRRSERSYTILKGNETEALNQISMTLLARLVVHQLSVILDRLLLIWITRVILHDRSHRRIGCSPGKKRTYRLSIGGKQLANFDHVRNILTIAQARTTASRRLVLLVIVALSNCFIILVSMSNWGQVFAKARHRLLSFCFAYHRIMFAGERPKRC